ncbi:MAG: hypothetical protein IH876_08545 [Gemmatimonadetes bacterium]|nr:hypothetical protein [Gemmatimonadota bacterium]MCH7716164.1 hypothetical protein [Gemmatimonadota bacterium]
MAKRKIAISVDSDVYKSAEQLRKATNESRSAVYERAMIQWLADHERGALTRQYVDAYKCYPETKAEVAAARAVALSILGVERWDEEG